MSKGHWLKPAKCRSSGCKISSPPVYFFHKILPSFFISLYLSFSRFCFRLFRGQLRQDPDPRTAFTSAKRRNRRPTTISTICRCSFQWRPSLFFIHCKQISWHLVVFVVVVVVVDVFAAGFSY